MQSGQFFAPEPAYFCGIAGGAQFPSLQAAEKINQHIVMLHPPVWMPQHAVEHSQQFSRLHDKSGFFPRLAGSSVFHQFADLQHTSGNRPLPLDGRMRAPDQHHPVAFDDDGANANQRLLGKLALHGPSDSKA